MEEALRQAWDNLFGRVDGPMSFRLIIQPVVATFLAIRAGWTDAREGRPIFFWTLARDPTQTRVMLRNLWRIAGKVFLVALVLDAIYQIIVLHWIYPVQALIVAKDSALCGNSSNLAGLGFAPDDAQRYDSQLRKLGVMVYVSCPEKTKTTWAIELLRQTGAREAAMLECAAAMEAVA